MFFSLSIEKNIHLKYGPKGNSFNIKLVFSSEGGRQKCTPDCFSILDQAANISQLKIKEAIHILWEKPSLNHQLAHVNLKLSL